MTGRVKKFVLVTDKDNKAITVNTDYIVKYTIEHDDGGYIYTFKMVDGSLVKGALSSTGQAGLKNMYV